MTRVSPWRVSRSATIALGLAVAAGPVAAQPLSLQPPASAAPAARPAAPKPLPLPPRRPAGLGQAAAPALVATAAATPVAGAPAAVAAAAAEPKPTPVRTAPKTREEAIERLNGYFNGFATLQGDFIQHGADGRKMEGKLYIQRPGKMRFEYRAPVTTEIVADGTSVAIRDRRLATQDLYSIGQTPLKFLVKERMDLNRDSTVTGVSTDGDIMSVRIEDRSTLGGTSKITLKYDMAANELRQWVVVDPQGYETSVSLYNLDTQRRPDPKNFVINYERVL